MLSGTRKIELRLIAVVVLLAAVSGTAYALPQARVTGQAVPRTADGKPNLQGIWQVRDKVAGDLYRQKALSKEARFPTLPRPLPKNRTT